MPVQAQSQSARFVEDAETFLARYYDEDIAQLANHYPRDQRSLYIDWMKLFQYDPDLADDYLTHPDDVRESFEEALRLHDKPIDIDLSGANVRVYNLPDEETLDVDEVSRHDNIGHMLGVKGQVQKVSDVKPRVETALFECQRCGADTEVPQFGDELQEPYQCEACERQGPFRLDPRRSEWRNHQVARVQQPPERTQGGSGASVDVHLEDDLIQEFQAGDRITLTGVLNTQSVESTQSRDFDTTLSARSVTSEESNYEDIDIDEHIEEIETIAAGERGDPYDLLVDSINPKHHGDEDVKLAIALQLFGGWAHEYPDGSRDRGDFHILMLGDPGCGKSTFLNYVDEIAPRSTYASGKGASAAGMTAAAVRDDFGDTEWGLEAGALVLADQGVACVDEIDKMQDDAVSSMHDALESQVVHVHKAGIEAQMNARTSLLAAGNPEAGRFDKHRALGEQIGLGPTLLSRFDLMFMVSDEPDPEQDADVVEHMLKSRQAAGRYTKGEQLSDEDQERVEPAIERELLRAYIAHAKGTAQPVIESEDVMQRLKEFFVGFRNGKSGEESPVPVTYREVEGIQRLAEASTRIRLSDTVKISDVERAINLVTTSMKQVGYDPETGEFDVDIIETGQSKSQRNRRNQIVEILGEENGLSFEDLVVEMDADEDTLEHDVKKLREKGRIYTHKGVLRKP